MSEMFDYAWREIIRRKGRSIGNLAGYFIAVIYLVITITFTGLSSKGANSVLQYTGAQFIAFIYDAGNTGGGVTFIDPSKEALQVHNNRSVLFPRAMAQGMVNSPNIRNAAPLLTFSMQTDDTSGRSWLIAGFDAADMESVRMVSCSATDIVEGKLLEPGDTGMVLLEQTFADTEQYGAGDIIKLGDQNYVVAGILSPGTRPAKADIYMTLGEATSLLSLRLHEPVDNVINALLIDGKSALLNRNAMTDAREILGFNASTIGYSCFNPAGAALGITTKGMRMLGLIVFVAVILLLGVSQYYGVVEREKDIGILKSIGWSDREVLMHLVSEPVVTSFLGGLAGCICAVILITVFPVGEWIGLDPEFVSPLNLLAVVGGFLSTILAASAAGIFSALKSLRIKPAEILRRI